MAFAVAHTQGPFPYSNQNQYFLHGVASAGGTPLAADWLANTADPTPLFSAAVRLGAHSLGDVAYQVPFFVMLMGYFLAAWWLVLGFTPDTPKPRRLAWAALFIAAHAAALRVLSVRLAGVDYPWFLQSGVAGQYLLGPGLQPSVFGVFLLAGVAAFARGRPVLAVVLQSVATAVHSTYLLPAGLLTAGYLVTAVSGGRTREAVRITLLAVVGILPAVGYTVLYFRPTSTDVFAEAQRVLAFVRIPHHTRIERWFDPVAALQLAWVAVGVALTRGTRLFPALATAAAGGAVLTLAQWASGNATFALFFPWRVSAVLVPVATAVIAGRATRLLPPAGWVAGGSLAVVAAAVGGGLVVTANGVGYAGSGADEGLYDHVARTRWAGDIYALPARFPAVGAGRGITSATFTPPPRPKPGSNQIPVDLQAFRLRTGAAIYVDFKSVPYLDAEVLEWRRRMEQCGRWYNAGAWRTPAGRAAMRGEGITHVVVPRDRPAAPDLQPVYADDAYTVVELER